MKVQGTFQKVVALGRELQDEDRVISAPWDRGVGGSVELVCVNCGGWVDECAEDCPHTHYEARITVWDHHGLGDQIDVLPHEEYIVFREVRLPEPEPKYDGHVFLVGVTLEGERRTTRQQAAESVCRLIGRINPPNPSHDPWEHEGYTYSWWIAEDDSTDGNDCDAAVFVNRGSQAIAYAVLHGYGLTAKHNNVPHSSNTKGA